MQPACSRKKASGRRAARRRRRPGPCYGIHRLGVPGEDEAALDIARKIEATYSGYEPMKK
jgi:hypothetical protein